MTKDNPVPKQFNNLYNTISQIIQESRNSVYRAANFTMVQAYWNIGKAIVEEEQSGNYRADYGKALIKNLAPRLSKEYGRSFSVRNLLYIKQFYNHFPNVNALRSELSWTHYRLLLKVKDKNARKFYIQETIDSNWSTRSLERQINNLYYQRILSSKDIETVKEEAIEKTNQQTPKDIIKDPYILDFLNLKDNANFRESELEQAIITKLQDFLLELGKGFAFVARQYRLSTETGKHFYADLVFYNYILKCFLIIDLKAAELSHQDIGQMDMYVCYFEDKVILDQAKF